jgi:hypothetical protein
MVTSGVLVKSVSSQRSSSSSLCSLAQKHLLASSSSLVQRRSRATMGARPLPPWLHLPRRRPSSPRAGTSRSHLPAARPCELPSLCNHQLQVGHGIFVFRSAQHPQLGTLSPLAMPPAQRHTPPLAQPPPFLAPPAARASMAMATPLSALRTLSVAMADLHSPLVGAGPPLV